MESKVPPPLPPKTSTLQSQAAPPPVPPKPRALQADAAQLKPKFTGEQCDTADTSPSVSPCNSTDSSSPFHDHMAIQERVTAPPPVPPRKRSSTPAVEQFEPQISPFTEVLFPHWPVPEAHHADFTTQAVTAAADEQLSPLKAARSRTTSEAVSVGDPFADWCSDLSPGSDAAAESAQTALWEPEAVESTSTAEVAAAVAALVAKTDHQDVDDVIDLSFPSAEEITSIAATASCLSSPASVSASSSRQFDSGHGFSAAWTGSGHGVTALARPKSVRFAAAAAAATVPATASGEADTAAARLSPVHHAVSEMLDAAIVRAAVAVTHNAAIKHTRAKSAAIEAAFLPVAGNSLLVVAAVTCIVNELVTDILAASTTAAQLKSTAAQAVPAAVETEVTAELTVVTAVVVPPPSVAVVAAAAETVRDVAESWAVQDVFTAPNTAVSDDTAWKPDTDVAADDSFTNFFSTDAVTNATTSSLTESADTEQQQWSFVTDFEETAVTEPTAAAATAAFSSAPAVDFSAFGSNSSSTLFSFAPAADEHKDSTFITSTDVDCDTAAAVTLDLPVVAVSDADVASDVVSDVVSGVFSESSKAMNSTASEFVAAVTAAAVSLDGSETTAATADATDAAAATESDTPSTSDATVSSIDIASAVQSVDAEELITIINSGDSGVQHADASVPVGTDVTTMAVCDEPMQTFIIVPEVQEVVEVLTDSSEVAEAVLAEGAADIEATDETAAVVQVAAVAVETVLVEVSAKPKVEQQLIEEPAVSAVETGAVAVAATVAAAAAVTPTAVEAAHSAAPPAAVVTESDAPFDAEPSQPSTVEMVTNRMTTHRSSFAGSTAAAPTVAVAVAAAAIAPVAAAVVPPVKSFQAAPWLAPPAPASPEAATADAATAARVAAAAAAATAAAIAVNEAAGVRTRHCTSSNRSAAAAAAGTAATASAAVNSVKTKARAFVSTTKGLLQRPLSMAKAVVGSATPGRKQQQQQQQQQSAARTTNSGTSSGGDADVSAAEGGYPESEYDDVQVDDEEDVDIGKFGFCGLRVSRSPSPSRSPSHRQQQR
jgi:hypothetical protein